MARTAATLKRQASSRNLLAMDYKYKKQRGQDDSDDESGDKGNNFSEPSYGPAIDPDILDGMLFGFNPRITPTKPGQAFVRFIIANNLLYLIDEYLLISNIPHFGQVFRVATEADFPKLSKYSLDLLVKWLNSGLRAESLIPTSEEEFVELLRLSVEAEKWNCAKLTMHALAGLKSWTERGHLTEKGAFDDAWTLAIALPSTQAVFVQMVVSILCGAHDSRSDVQALYRDAMKWDAALAAAVAFRSLSLLGFFLGKNIRITAQPSFSLPATANPFSPATAVPTAPTAPVNKTAPANRKSRRANILSTR